MMICKAKNQEKQATNHFMFLKGQLKVIPKIKFMEIRKKAWVH